MIAPELELYLVPAEAWKGDTEPAFQIHDFVRDALGIERRIKKGVNLELERTRYRLCCRRIQDAVSHMAGGGQLTALRLGADYLVVLRDLFERFPEQAARGRLAACFFPPDTSEGRLMSEQIETFEKLATEAGIADRKEVSRRLDFFRAAREQGAGIVEVVRFSSTRADQPVAASLIEPESMRAATDASLTEVDALSEETRHGKVRLLCERIEAAASNGGTVNFSNQPHFVITEALHHCVFKKDTNQPEGTVRVVYSDGSEAAPFPIRCLANSGISEMGGGDRTTLNVSLVSMRHLEMDHRVEIAWFRNQKVSVPRPCAEIDAYCTGETVRLLNQLGEEPLMIRLFQTGLETAVVGFYRGLVEVLASKDREARACRVQVIPMYYKGPDKGYEEGKSWV